MNALSDMPELVLTRGWIDGQEVDSESEFSVINPATLSVVAKVSDLGAQHARDAIAAATAAFAGWKTVPLQQRVDCILRWAVLIEENTDALGKIVHLETGKPLPQAKGEAMQCAALLRWFAELAPQLNEEAPAPGDSGQRNTGQRNYSIKQPVGVVACITPWNFPAAAVIVKAGAAIAAGCTTIVKPSEETPLIALTFAKLAARAGIPDGVFNVVPCKDPAQVGNELCQSSDVRMLSFTGSIKIGKQLYAACGSTVKRLALELGGNAPFIVFADADLEKALDGAMGARFYNSGQICVGANRYYIHESVYAEFARKLTGRVDAMHSEDIGPMINRAAVDRLNDLVDSASAMGAEVLAGGKQNDPETLFFSPTVLGNMNAEMQARHAELFGPIVCLYAFEDEQDVLRQANDTEAGLSAYVYSADADRLQRFAEGLEAGVVGANSANIFANDLPFGGIKQSGIGREHGKQCLEEYVETKSICLGTQ
jgi:succinate-semialdehyde dehydrogenase/glutarate-semialdehyde dehydrogenase